MKSFCRLRKKVRQVCSRVVAERRAAALPVVLELRQRAGGEVGPVREVVVHEAQDGELVAIDKDRIRFALAADEVVSLELGNLTSAND